MQVTVDKILIGSSKIWAVNPFDLLPSAEPKLSACNYVRINDIALLAPEITAYADRCALQ